MELKVTGSTVPSSISIEGYDKTVSESGSDYITETTKTQKDDIDEREISNAVKKLNNFLEDEKAYAEYSIHEKFGDIMIKIIDSDTKQVIMEVPPRKILDMVAKMCELVGIVFDKKA